MEKKRLVLVEKRAERTEEAEKRADEAEMRAEEAEKRADEAETRAEEAETRANKMFKVLEVNIDTTYEMKDAAPQSTISRSMWFAIISIILLVTTVLMIALNINGLVM